ncbi:MAG: cytochrome c [Planctomycetes bacterium]|nr:cytochrome c [Planctomycetota bacterium]
MQRLFAAGVGGVLLGVVLFSGSASVGADKDKKDVPSVEDIMKVINKPKGLHKAVGKALAEDTVKWDAVAKMSKEYNELASVLGKNPCPKGNAGSWDKLCKSYAADAKALDEAAGKKDKAAAVTAMGKLNKSCQGCHDEHR